MGSSFSIFEPTMKAAAILVAAGSSTRMGFDKLTAPLAGQPLLYWEGFQPQNQSWWARSNKHPSQK
jgi:molybdopterin-guanine dinucleotide biosynthesis protein A